MPCGEPTDSLFPTEPSPGLLSGLILSQHLCEPLDASLDLILGHRSKADSGPRAPHIWLWPLHMTDAPCSALEISGQSVQGNGLDLPELAGSKICNSTRIHCRFMHVLLRSGSISHLSCCLDTQNVFNTYRLVLYSVRTNMKQASRACVPSFKLMSDDA